MTPVTCYFDSSALVKRYMREAGTTWVQGWCDDLTQVVAVAEIGLVEMAAAFAGKLRGGFITAAMSSDARADLLEDARSEYVLVASDRSIVGDAIDLTGPPATARLRCRPSGLCVAPESGIDHPPPPSVTVRFGG